MLLLRCTALTGFALLSVVLAPCGAGAEDAPPTPAPAPAEGGDAATEVAQARALYDEAKDLYLGGEPEAALPKAREALALRERVLAADAPALAESLGLVGLLAWEVQKDAKEARALLERALGVGERTRGAQHADLVPLLQNLAHVARGVGEHAEAVRFEERALGIQEQAPGGGGLGTASTLERIADSWYAQGDPARSVPALERALAIREEALGPTHSDVAGTLNSLGVRHSTLGEFARARTYLARALAIYRAAGTSSQRQVAATLGNLAAVNYRLGELAEAAAACKQAIALGEAALGSNHPDLCEPLSCLAAVHAARAEFGQARGLFERVLAIREAVLGAEHPDLSSTLSNLGVMSKELGDLRAARAFLERADSIQRRSLPAGHPARADVKANLAVVLGQQGDAAAAREMLRECVRDLERTLGPDHPTLAIVLSNLANYVPAAEASVLHARAVAASARRLGAAHPQVGEVLVRQARALQAAGAFGAATECLVRASQIFEEKFGGAHPSLGRTLRMRAWGLQELGAHAEARVLAERAAQILEAALGSAHPQTREALLVLGLSQANDGELGAAIETLERALALAEQAPEADPVSVAQVLNNLGSVLLRAGQAERACAVLERAVALRVARGNDDSGVHARLLDNLGKALAVRGDTAGAIERLRAALALRMSSADVTPKDLAIGHANLGLTFLDAGDVPEARRLLDEALDLFERYVQGNLATLGPQQRLAMVRDMRRVLDLILRNGRRLGIDGLAEVLRIRGLVLRMERTSRRVSRRGGAELEALQGPLREAEHDVSVLANRMPPRQQLVEREAWQAQYAAAAARREALARSMATHMARLEGVAPPDPSTVHDVQRLLPPGACLVEVLRAANVYYAWVLPATGPMLSLGLGSAEPIEAACAAFVLALARGETGAQEGQALRALVWAPIEAGLGEGTRHVVLVLDAALAAVPFAALPGKKAGTYLLDEVPFSHLFHAKDLATSTSVLAGGMGALVVGGVDFERAEASGAGAQGPPALPAVAALDRAPKGSAFPPLPQTHLEAEALRSRLGTATVALLLGRSATEAAVRQAVQGKRILHFATHGFAREDLMAGLQRGNLTDGWVSTEQERQLAAGHDPLLLSGLALAGANPRDGANGDDGILTALEASYLDLDGVDLVTLSACETARGTAESGEGVLGLVSAFQMAGARSVVASLWKVDDEATRLLMDGFYERVLRKEHPLPPAEALRAAALALRDRQEPDGTRRFAAPRYWAAFVAYGR